MKKKILLMCTIVVVFSIGIVTVQAMGNERTNNSRDFKRYETCNNCNDGVCQNNGNCSNEECPYYESECPHKNSQSCQYDGNCRNNGTGKHANHRHHHS